MRFGRVDRSLRSASVCSDGDCSGSHDGSEGGCHSTNPTTTRNDPTPTRRTMTMTSSSSSSSKFSPDDLDQDLENPPILTSSQSHPSTTATTAGQPRTCQCACSPRTKPNPRARHCSTSVRPLSSTTTTTHPAAFNEKNPLHPTTSTTAIPTLYSSTTPTPNPTTAKQTRRRNQRNRRRRQRYSVPFLWQVEGSRAGLEMLVQAIHYLMM